METFPNIRVFKALRGSPKGKAQREKQNTVYKEWKPYPSKTRFKGLRKSPNRTISASGEENKTL